MFKLKNPRLRRALPIQILSWAFIIIPIVTLPISVYFNSPKYWTEPAVWKLFFQNMVFASKIWGILLFTSGILLQFQRKWTWALAIATMIFSGIYTYTVIGPLEIFPAWFKYLGFVGIGLAFLVLGYFRFPFIDTRDYWFGVAHRYTNDGTGFPVHFKEDVGRGEVVDISIKGAKIHFKDRTKLPKVGDTLHIRYADDLHLMVEIKRIKEDFHGVEFVRPNGRQKKAINVLIRFLSNRKETFVLEDD